ncbi:PEP-CTERM sorting domain-containing protein [Microcystis sp. M061S2]|uniref:PEP-CTERM sorting domain-containing protein n=1 Tax=Microcystis sp. M061S2 TaxID=2771171 RepID=UPI002585A3C5|nr:PEP-CTERM sorting domain-containing protein [Microcystis sp. M061S2]MCA2652982.1 PEP-CTERM sorting domain-containing protein [Microcystis sp. M061S2]
MINTRLKPVTTGLIGAVGLGVALLGMPEGAKAVDIKAGRDYFETNPSNTTVTIPGIGVVPLQGSPITPAPFPGFPVDTILERIGDCTFDEGLGDLNPNSCTVGLKIIALSVKSASPVGLPGGGQSFIFITLNGAQSEGTITINNNNTWEANLPVKAVAKDENGGVLASFGPSQLIGSGTWSINPDTRNFLPITTIPFTGPEETHGFLRVLDIPPVPEPSTVLGLIAVGLSSIVGFKGKKEQK